MKEEKNFFRRNTNDRIFKFSRKKLSLLEWKNEKKKLKKEKKEN